MAMAKLRSRLLDRNLQENSCPLCVCNATSSEGPLIVRILAPVFSYLTFKTYLEQVAEEYAHIVDTADIQIQIIGVATHAELEKEILFDVRQRAGQFDAYILNPLLTGQLAVEDGLWDLTDFIRNYQRNPNFWTDILLFYRDILSSYDNKIVLFPFDGDVLSMYYRADLLEEHGLKAPVTWEEYSEIAKYFHGRLVEQEDPVTGNMTNVTMAGSCVARSQYCSGAYWSQMILSTMTQYEGTSTGSLLDTADLTPLLGPAMEETLRLMEEQAQYGVDEFEGCVETQIAAMNHGKCVLSYNWGGSFVDHLNEGSILRGKLGVSPTPGSSRVLNRATMKLENCTPELCPFASRHVDLDGNELWVNFAPYAAYGGWSGAVSNNVSPRHKQAAADFLAFASDTGQAIKYVIPDSSKPHNGTGQDPYRKSMLDVDRWVARDYPRKTIEDYLQTIQTELSSENVVHDVRFPKATSILDVLDKHTFDYLNLTILMDSQGVNRTALRKAITQNIHSGWVSLITEFDSHSAVPLLEIYQRSRGIFIPSLAATKPAPTQEDASISTGGVIGVSLGAAAFVALAAFLIGVYVVRRERKKHEATWFIPPEDILDTGEVLGRGSFGVVTKGYLRGTAIALKHPKATVQSSLLGDDTTQKNDDWNDASVAFDHVMSATRPGSDGSLHPLQSELATLVRLRHPSIVQMLGATIRDEKMVLVLQYMQNNTIRSILKDPNRVVGTALLSLKAQWARQVAEGLAFLHNYPTPKGPLLHNDLKSSNVLVDGSFNALIADFGLATSTMRGMWGWIQGPKQHHPKGSLLWIAPEILNGASQSPASDVYSYGMFLCELLTKARPYDYKMVCSNDSITAVVDGGKVRECEAVDDLIDASATRDSSDDPPIEATKAQHRTWRRRLSCTGSVSSVESDGMGSSNTKELKMCGTVEGIRYSRKEIVERVKDVALDPPFRPDLPDSAKQVLTDICIECWHKNPLRRPTMTEVEKRLTMAVSSESVAQRLMRRGSVFDSILPPDVQEKLANGEVIKPVSYSAATVIFSDIVGFTSICSTMSPEEVGDLIARLMTKFDRLCKVSGIRKLDVIGDAFLGVAGVPEECEDHAFQAAEFALAAIEAAQTTLVCTNRPELGFIKVRFGIASGPVVATVIGSAEHPKYTLFGDTVNVASRMETSGLPNKCHCTEHTAELVRKLARVEDITIEERGIIKIKGKGDMKTFILS